VYQTTTLEGWTEQMQDLQNTMDKYIWLYSFLLVFFGSLIIINLVLAVVTIRFVQAQEMVQSTNSRQGSINRRM
jgi:hypothetical protein